MWNFILKIGNWIRSAQGFWSISSTLMTTVLLYLYSLYEQLNWLEKTALVLAIVVLLLFLIIFILKIKERLFQTSYAIPIIDIYKNAEKNGWDFGADGGFQLFDFTKALKQAGLDRKLTFRGRMNKYEFEELSRKVPFVDISKDHWDLHEIDWINIYQCHKFINDNFYARSYSMEVKRGNKCNYNDLYVIGVNKKWCRDALVSYKGRALKARNTT